MNNGIFLIGARLIVPVMSMALTVTMARLLGKEGIGNYASILALVMVFMGMSTLGIRNIIIREVGANRALAGNYFANASFIVFCLSFIAYCMMILYARLNHYNDTLMNGLYIAGICLIPFSISYIIESIFIAEAKNKVIFKGSLIQHSFRVVCSVVALLLGYGLNAVLIVYTISNFVVLLPYAAALKDLGFKHFGISIAFIKDRIVSFLAIFLLLDVIASIYSRLGVIVLTGECSAASVGLYAAGIGLNVVIAMIPANIAIAAYPMIASNVTDTNKMKSQISKSIRHSLILVLPLVILCFAFAPELIRLVYGIDFELSATVFRIVLIGDMALCFSLSFTFILLATKRQGYELSIVAISTGIFFVGLELMITQYDIFGAAIASTVSLFILMSMQWYTIRKKIFKPQLIPLILTFIPVIAIWSILVILVKLSGLNYIVSIIVLIVLYFMVVFKSKLITPDEMALIRSTDIFKKVFVTG